MSAPSYGAGVLHADVHGDPSHPRVVLVHGGFWKSAYDLSFGLTKTRFALNAKVPAFAAKRIPPDVLQAREDMALVAHASQIDPGGFFFAVPRDIEVDVWSTEEFELADSRVPTSTLTWLAGTTVRLNPAASTATSCASCSLPDTRRWSRARGR